MNISEAKKHYICGTKIDITPYVGGKDEFIEMREPTIEEYTRATTGTKRMSDDEAAFSACNKMFPGCMMSSSLVNEKGDALTGKEVLDFLGESYSGFTNIIKTWLDSFPFSPVQKKKEK